MEEHLDAQGVPRRERREARLAKEAREVELLTKIELAVKDKKGLVRERRPLFLVGSRFERLKGSKWELDGMELQVNPLIYGGVRADETGKLGRNFGLGTDRLPQLDPRRHPAALALGLLLPIRFRLARNEGKDSVALAGQTILRYAGIRYSPNHSGRAWEVLADDLDELQRIGGIGRWAWGGDGVPGLLNTIRFWPAAWAADRALHGVRPLELPAARPLTGKELRDWRVGAKLSQAQAAAELGVGLRTIERNEGAPEKLLGPALRAALQAVLERAAATSAA
jgi:hypothetical protein